ncbi:SIR2 family protein [Ferrovibrio sp.]|uniref:SIR2 family NAD-dependent protein deacylase n=1 Tax=Ferrovibrio sp. TaxID=1917215 RepID=UPI000CBAEEA6|nr:SIR2 family protein [Ferrovibrio sp.]PJI41844.1 MAG: SIR2 family protein [Ferrovibrio sp.]
MTHHPDQEHINTIRTALWSGQQYGEAAVMVGAGMSQNAKKKFQTAPPFPNWGQLMEPFLSSLYPNPADGTMKAERSKLVNATSEALRIANEYAALHSDVGLEALLKTAIPDNHYLPSDLHHRLVRQRWADVFTTNWDTLLERAADEMSLRRYSYVRKMNEIPTSRQPRITKLHGSFPSNGPFILTEEQFRCYPERYAPFVNMVRQSIMENTFCLLGFSGNDPNFLQWSGWVRDNLGSHTRPIFLVIHSPLRKAQMALLQQRHIHVVDLSILFSDGEPDRYGKMLEWFLMNLEAGRPPDVGNWPEIRTYQPKRAVRDMSHCRYKIFDYRGTEITL